jgi:hypothetical protein
MAIAKRITIIGAGPAGLMAAETLLGRGFDIDIYDAMPSFGRKFLMAGKSGLNITHAEHPAAFNQRYMAADPKLVEAVSGFGAKAISDWMKGLGIEAHQGPTGRIFPTMMKASPLLRAWLNRLSGGGVSFHTRHRWMGWRDDGLVFSTPDREVAVRADATILALGGASWRRLGSDGEWAQILSSAGIETAPFQPSNCGFLVDWSDHLKAKVSGQPIKSCALSVRSGGQTHYNRGEFVLTARGVESGGVYMLSAPLRDALIEDGTATLTVDLAPDVSLETLAAKLAKPRKKQTLTNHLRKTAGLSAAKIALVYEFAAKDMLSEPDRLARLIKAIDIPITGTTPIDEAISTAGGVPWAAMDERFMLFAKPGVFCAGEMLAWDAPTGGYLITACLATGRAAGLGVVEWLG